MRSDTLKRNYSYLKAEERFKLSLEAIRREDSQEFDRLYTTCPCKEYSMQDSEYINRLHASERVAYIFALSWFCLLRKKDGAEMAITTNKLVAGRFEEGVLLGIETSGGSLKEGSSIFKKLNEKLDHYDALIQEAEEALRHALASMKGLYLALFRFCREVDLKPEKMLAWVHPINEGIEELKHIFDGDLQADAEMETMAYEKFNRIASEVLVK